MELLTTKDKAMTTISRLLKEAPDFASHNVPVTETMRRSACRSRLHAIRESQVEWFQTVEMTLFHIFPKASPQLSRYEAQEELFCGENDGISLCDYDAHVSMSDNSYGRAIERVLRTYLREIQEWVNG